ncbi:MAG TPA: patatin-like phospholipase family protein [Verrucomicrobiae bacterium]|nr:patatin-like phospholipase family protein [Verrucomicrobiae bacterium]
MEDKLQVLENVAVLASLGTELMKSLAERAEFVAVKKGELVVRENDPGDALYVVVSGRLQAYTSLKSGRDRVFATYCDGECFGEMPLLSGETHWANVRALNDSVLLKIPRDDFESLVNRDPRVAVSFSQRMGHRMKELREEKHRAKWSTIISVYSSISGTGKTTLAHNLVSSLARETGEPVLLLDLTGKQRGIPLLKCERLDFRSGLGLQDIMVHSPLGYDRLNLDLVGDEREIALIAPVFGHLVKQYDYVICDVPNEVSQSVFECLVQSDKVFVLARNDDDHLYRTRLLVEDFRSRAGAREPEVRLILTAVGEAGTPYVEEAERKIGQPISYLLRWIPDKEVVQAVDGTPYVIRQPMDPYSLVVRRMARELGNVLVGLALGTGGARGLAHIGVIRVLEREGIGIDVVAGSSMGSLIAAAWAVGKSADEMQEIAKQIRNKRTFLKLLDPMFPGAGVFRGIKVYKFLDSIVNGLTFADTLIPLKIVASDLNTLEEVVYEEGKLIDAIRASITIPGIFRPVVNDGRTLIDGGITDPVPVQVLAWAGVSKIIAVNTIPNTEEMKQRERNRHEMAKAAPKERNGVLHETGPLVETPTSIINIYMRSMHAMQSRMAEMACNNADVVIRPLLAGSVWYDFYHPERYIRCGEEAAEAVLPQLKELVRA